MGITIRYFSVFSVYDNAYVLDLPWVLRRGVPGRGGAQQHFRRPRRADQAQPHRGAGRAGLHLPPHREGSWAVLVMCKQLQPNVM